MQNQRKEKEGIRSTKRSRSNEGITAMKEVSITPLIKKFLWTDDKALFEEPLKSMNSIAKSKKGKERNETRELLELGALKEFN